MAGLDVAVIGAGYVGLVTAAGLARLGHRVRCVDIDPGRMQALLAARAPFFEPGLDELIAAEVAAGRLRPGESVQAAVTGADAVLLAVGTPTRRGSGAADLCHLERAVDELRPWLARGALVVVRSTVPVGTGDRLAARLRGAGVEVVSHPEFLRQGAAIDDFLRPDRLVLGVGDPQAPPARLEQLVGPLGLPAERIVVTDRRSAELTKLAANALLALRLGFVGEVADVCERVGVDVDQVTRGLGLDHRLGKGALRPGPGFGGSCLPKDALALCDEARRVGVPMRTVEATLAANRRRVAGLVGRARAALGGSLVGRRVAVLGLSFKPGTDDLRDAPSLALLPALRDEGAEVRAHDPHASDAFAQLVPGVERCATLAAALRGAELVVLLVDWPVYRAIPPQELARRVASGAVVLDLWRALDAPALRAAGLHVRRLGDGRHLSAVAAAREREPC